VVAIYFSRLRLLPPVEQNTLRLNGRFRPPRGFTR
jgi:hypothetical protein